MRDLFLHFPPFSGRSHLAGGNKF